MNSPKEILVVGDSIAYGFRLWRWQSSWVDLLAKDLSPLSLEKNLKCGVMTDEMCDQLPVKIAHREWLKIVFAIGINDSRNTDSRDRSMTEIPLEAFRENMRLMIRLATKHAQKEVVVVGLTPVDEARTSFLGKFYSAESVALFDQALQAIAREKGITHINVADAFNPSSRQDACDGLHPTKVGHEKLYQVIKSHFLPHQKLTACVKNPSKIQSGV